MRPTSMFLLISSKRFCDFHGTFYPQLSNQHHFSVAPLSPGSKPHSVVAFILRVSSSKAGRTLAVVL